MEKGAQENRALEAALTALGAFCTQITAGVGNPAKEPPAGPLGLLGYESINHGGVMFDARLYAELLGDLILEARPSHYFVGEQSIC